MSLSFEIHFISLNAEQNGSINNSYSLQMRTKNIMPLSVNCFLLAGPLCTSIYKNGTEISPFKAGADQAEVKLPAGFGASKLIDNIASLARV